MHLSFGWWGRASQIFQIAARLPDQTTEEYPPIRMGSLQTSRSKKTKASNGFRMSSLAYLKYQFCRFSNCKVLQFLSDFFFITGIVLTVWGLCWYNFFGWDSGVSAIHFEIGWLFAILLVALTKNPSRSQVVNGSLVWQEPADLHCLESYVPWRDVGRTGTELVGNSKGIGWLKYHLSGETCSRCVIKKKNPW